MESSIQIDKARNEFLIYIVTALNMQIQQFMEAITYSDNCYERLVYRWSVKLFKKGRTKEEALNIILKGRNILLIQRDRLQNQLILSERLIELLQMLKCGFNYKMLTPLEQQDVVEKIKELTGTEQVEKVMNEALGSKYHYVYTNEGTEFPEGENEDEDEDEEEFEKRFQRLWAFLKKTIYKDQ